MKSKYHNCSSCKYCEYIRVSGFNTLISLNCSKNITPETTELNKINCTSWEHKNDEYYYKPDLKELENREDSKHWDEWAL